MSSRIAQEIWNRMRRSRTPGNEFWSSMRRTPTQAFPAVAHELRKIPEAQQVAFGPIFPKEYDENYWWPHGLFAIDPARSVAWSAAQLRAWAPEIKRFLLLEESVAAALQIDEKDRVIALLDEIDSSFGKSMWSLETRLSTLEIQSGVRTQKQYVEELLDDTRDRNRSANAASLLTFLSYKAESNVPVSRFNADLKRALGIEGDRPADEFDEFLLFRLAFFGEQRFTRIGELLIYCRYGSLIDRYLDFIRLAQVVMVEERARPYVHYFKAAVEALVRTLPDPRLESLALMYGAACSPADEYSTISTALEDYTLGRPFQEIDASRMSAGERVAWLELRSKWLARGGPIVDTEKLAASRNGLPSFDNLTVLVRQVLDKSAPGDAASSALLKVVYQFSHASWAAALFGILMREMRNSLAPGMDRYAVLGDLNTYPKNPRLMARYSGNNRLASPTAETTIRLLEITEHGGEEEIETLKDVLPRTRYLKYSALLALRGGHPERAETLLSELFNLGDFLDKQDAIENLARCVSESESAVRTIPLIVDAVVSHPGYRTRINVQHLVAAIRKSRAHARIPAEWLISVPILQDILYRAGQRMSEGVRSAGCEDFLLAMGVERPSQLKPHAAKFEKQQLVYFLRHVCVVTVLDSNISYSSSRDVEDERVDVCRWLMDIDPESKQVYAEEIAGVVQKQLIVQDITDIEKSKIYVDVDGIRNSVYAEGRDLYDRFHSLPESDKEALYDIVAQVSEQLRSLDGKQLHIIMPPSKKEDAFKELYTLVRDRFVSSSEFGLDVYLSVGIRHSTLEKHLRSVFEAQHLITQRGSDGKYEANLAWINEATGESLPDEGQEAFRKFSQGIDALIAKLKSQWIQIKTAGKNPEGLFDFSTYSRPLFSQAKNAGTFEDVVELILSDLWESTDRALAKVRQQLHDSLLPDFEALTQNLAKDLRTAEVLDPGLSGAIAQARTNIQAQIARTSEWFTRTTRRNLNDYQLHHAIDIAVEMLSRCYPANALAPSIKVDLDGLLRGDSLIGIVTILYTALDNILEHSRVIGRAPNVAIEAIRTAENALRLTIRNEVVRQQAEIGPEQAKLAELLKEASSGRVLDKVKHEGGTGLLKIARAVKVDLRAICDVKAKLTTTEFELILQIQGGRLA